MSSLSDETFPHPEPVETTGVPVPQSTEAGDASRQAYEAQFAVSRNALHSVYGTVFEFANEQRLFNGLLPQQQRLRAVGLITPVLRIHARLLVENSPETPRGYVPWQPLSQFSSSYYKYMRRDPRLEAIRVRAYEQTANLHLDTFPEIRLADDLRQALEARREREEPNMAALQIESTHDLFKIYGMILLTIQRQHAADARNA